MQHFIRTTLFFLLAAACVVRADLLNKTSMTAPFSQLDFDGNRIVSFFAKGGNARPMQSFVRLTNDRENQRGWLWSRALLNTNTFSSLFKFRISGGDERNHGDNLSFHLTNKRGPSDGDTYGFESGFTGVVIVVDTNRDADPFASRHRDVRVLVNDGTLNKQQMMDQSVGCNANLRYWEGRDDFNALKASAIRVRMNANGKELIVDVDSRNTGRWRRCTTVNVDSLPGDWVSQSTLGIMAHTSPTSFNNQDMLHVGMFDDPNEASSMDSTQGDSEMDGKDAEMMHLVHHMEHELFGVHAKLSIAMSALDQAETAAEARIAELEDRFHRRVQGILESRVSALEQDVNIGVRQALEKNLQRVAAKVETKVGRHLEDHLGGGVGGGVMNWQTPFYMLFGVMGAGMLLSWFKYNETKKSHLL